jgi:hypothetical protein
LIRLARATLLAANTVFRRRTPDFKMNEYKFAKFTHGREKTTRETLTTPGDKNGASAFVPPPKKCPQYFENSEYALT